MPLRKTIPTSQLADWYEIGWAYVTPDFDAPDHSIIEWRSSKPPVQPFVIHCVPVTPDPESAYDAGRQFQGTTEVDR